jgi:Lysozyme like domain/Putative peptidoglycan binding domain
MSILTVEQVATHCHRAGFGGEALVTIVAIAQGESGFRADAIGDTSLVDRTWGPSIGLLQIRSLHRERGTGGTRDELANFDPAHNARSGFVISSHGQSFGPWTVFTSGAYLHFMDKVRSACRAVDDGVASIGADDPLLMLGSVGDAVGRMQEMLDVVGFPQPGDHFRVFGKATFEAVSAYQASRSLTVDGVVGPETWGALNSGAGPA